MFPVLFRIPLPDFLKGISEDGYFPIRMFGVMVILGFLLGTWIVSRRLKRQGIMEPQDTFDFCFYILAVGILGARVLYVLQNFGDFQGKPLDVFKIWKGGLVWYGGMAASTLFALWWLWRKKKPVLACADAAALGTSIALAIGRWGCFFAGDDYGKLITAPDGTPIESAEQAPWYAVQFPRYEPEHDDATWRYRYSEAPSNFRAPHWVHPVQIYMSIGNVIVFLALVLIARKTRKPGIVAGWYLILYPVNRFIVEFWRGDEDRGVEQLGTPLSFSQLFGIPMVLLGIVILRMAASKPAATPQSPATVS
jgi:phosphatidylglycerol---prolipoprotein diacylglyceryl transferase